MRLKMRLWGVVFCLLAAASVTQAASTVPYEASVLSSGQIPVSDSTADGKLKASSCTDNGSTVICTEPLQAPAVMTVNAGTFSVTGNANIVECSSVCTVTFPPPIAGAMQCVRNEAGIATVITIAAITSVLFEKTDNSGYGTAGTGTMVSGGANGDKVCLVGRDPTHYDVYSFKGAWVNS